MPRTNWITQAQIISVFADRTTNPQWMRAEKCFTRHSVRCFVSKNIPQPNGSLSFRSNWNKIAKLYPWVLNFVKYQTRKIVFKHISKQEEESWKHDAQRSIFDELWGCANRPCLRYQYSNMASRLSSQNLKFHHHHHHHHHHILYLNTIGFKAESLWGRVKIITIWDIRDKITYTTIT